MTVVLDPGHGGKSAGATSKLIKEKDLVLAVALKVGAKIKKEMKDVRVLYTRSTDTFINLEDRSLFANKNKADLFISIHANSTKSATPFGTETFVMGEDKLGLNLELVLKENADIKFEDNYQTKYIDITQLTSSSIEFDLKQKMYFDQSFALASFVEENFVTQGRTSRGVKPAPYLVLWHAAMPSILVEMGFISNKQEEAFLKTTKGQDIIATSIADAIKNYKSKWEEDPLFAKIVPDVPNSDEAIRTFREVPEKTQDTTKDIPQIRYHVQILSGKKIPMNSREFKGEKKVYAFPFNEDEYKYCVGSEMTKESAKRILEKIREKFPKAFIITTEDGKIK